MIFNKGDKVTVLDEAMEGVVISVLNNRVMVLTTDGFELAFDPKELLKTGESQLNFNIGPNLNQIIREKEIPKPRSFVKEKKTREIPAPEFDLHIEKLVKNFRQMNNYEIL